MKKYINTMKTFLDVQHPQAECNCYADFELDEEFLCDLCRVRLQKQRKKLKSRHRRDSRHKFKNKYCNND